MTRTERLLETIFARFSDPANIRVYTGSLPEKFGNPDLDNVDVPALINGLEDHYEVNFKVNPDGTVGIEEDD